MVAVFKKGLVVVAIIIAFVIGTQNPQVVNVNFIIASTELPLATVLSLCLALGVVIGLLSAAAIFSKLKWQNYRLKKSNTKLTRQPEQ
ncbi:lipopolysaccharide assembly protein LapA domain-containing protein [Pseudoalteromonas sp. T1lg65]|uniref:lipopolysaccharide assembly protein LapA domain-containing protein n=1 Tax=Pseudoalteromonas sp. T1lg65 TaxID=2077101 RepID=UPI003F78F66C